MPRRKPAKRKAPLRKVAKGKGAKAKIAKRKVTKRKATTRKVTRRKVAKPKVAKRKAAKRIYKVFIAWSGNESKFLGTRLQKRLPIIIPNIEILFSPTFNPGDAWARRLQASIRKADYAILCVTKESLDSRWMNFEAGAAWHALKQENVCPLLLDVPVKDLLDSPLSQFQMKQFDDVDFEELCKYFARKTRLNLEKFKGNFDVVWSALKQEVRDELARIRQSTTP